MKFDMFVILQKKKFYLKLPRKMQPEKLVPGPFLFAKN